MGQELRDKYPIYPRSCPQEGEVGHTIDRCINHLLVKIRVLRVPSQRRRKVLEAGGGGGGGAPMMVRT